MKKKQEIKRYEADFETSTWNKNETWVWAWCLVNIYNLDDIKYGNNIESFINAIKNLDIINFHNLKFDGEFIIYYLLKNGFTHVSDKKQAKDMTFSTLISDMGLFYEITIYFEKNKHKTKKVIIRDSLKIINMPVKKIPNAFNLPDSKLEIDYNKPRKKNHILTKEEKDYITEDVLIVAKALKMMYDLGLEKMTIGSNALANYKGTISRKRFELLFPNLDNIDSDLRQSYRGGFTYLNPFYKEKIVKNIVNLDVNSLYPSVMRYEALPYGEPIFYEGKYEEDKIYPLYIQMIYCNFKIKKNKIPTIQIKHSMRFSSNEYLRESGDEGVCLCLTSVDLKLFLEQYDVTNLKYLKGWKFKQMNNIFSDYIDYWINIKNEATINKNKGMRTIAKLMLNSLYGKYATSLEAKSKIPYLDENDIVKYKISDAETKEGLYIPIASFITSYARNKTIRTAQTITDYSIQKYGRDAFIYSDTDSIKTTLSIEELEKIVDIDDVKLGAWKNEGIARKAKFLRQKCYVEEIDGDLNITCAGLPESCYENVTFNNFKIGFKTKGKLLMKHVKGRYHIRKY